MPIALDINTLLVILLSVVFVLLVWIIRLEMKLRKFLKGKDAKSLEDVIVNLEKDTSDLGKFDKEIEDYLKSVEKRLSRSIQGCATMRFNPFKGTGEGGNQSFATAMINEKGNGVIVSSLYSRERTIVFSKPLVNFKSEYELSSEEKAALSKARESMHS